MTATKRWTAHVLSCLLASALALLGPTGQVRPALAQRGKVSPEVRGHLTNAQRAEKGADWAKALAEYQAANEIEPSTTALGGIARAHYELGNVLQAYDAYSKLYQRLVEPDLSKQKVPQRLKELEGQTGTIAVAMTEPGAVVSLDGEELGKSPLQIVRRVKAGPHVLRAVKDKTPPYDQPVTVPGGQNAVIDLHFPPPPKPDEEPKATVISLGPQVPTDDPDAAWNMPHGSKKYVAVRISKPPKIDGVLDDEAWKLAPRDTRFQSRRSKPYGKPTPEPTEVQLAYDDENLYVAFTSAYSSKRPRDDSFSPDEEDATTKAESVAVVIDSLHNHSSCFAFAVSRAGVRGDVEFSESGLKPNLDWRGIWDVSVTRGPDIWYAEFKIPWGAMRMPSRSGPFDLGINFRRHESVSGEWSLWALPPPATLRWDTNYFGHLEGLSDIHPGQRLYLQPYVAVGADQDPSTTSLSPLYDFTTKVADSHVRAFAGLYARYQPPGPFRLDATFNPNFFGVNPDQARANLDRFELEFPEARPFFAEDNPRFAFGGDPDFGTQLFYSRRIGYQTDTAGFTRAVPILWGAKTVLRTSSTDLSIMNVGLSSDSPTIELADNVTVGRFSQNFGQGRKVGVIAMGRAGDVDQYFSGGADGEVTFFDRHLAVSGFYAQSYSKLRHATSGAGQAKIAWVSQDFAASAMYVDIGTNFDSGPGGGGQLGYFPLAGVRGGIFNAAYTPVVRNDLVQQVYIAGKMSVIKDRQDRRVYDRGVITASIGTMDNAFVSATLLPAIEDVANPFPIANGKIQIRQGSYKVMQASFDVSTNTRSTVFGALGFNVGDLFDGQQRAPSAMLGLNLGRFTAQALYRLYYITYPGFADVVGHQVSARAAVFYTPLAKSVLTVEMNTVSARALAQLVNSYTFGQLSEIALVLRANSGTRFGDPQNEWYDKPSFVGLLSFAFGFTPF